MADTRREALITGIGIVSCLGEGEDSHWQALASAEPKADTAAFAPFIVHPIAPLDYDKQITKKGDQRQMEPWQRIGTYAAGLALDSAGVKGKADLLEKMDMIVAAGGGERDLAVDSTILSGRDKAPSPGAFLNERLMNDLRPTLFLAQLSNLLAGNISIVHGVTGSSRTFMGEETSGVDAVRIALARINAGQSDIALVGGAHNGERKDLLMLYEFGHCNLKEKFAPVWERAPSGGFALASMGAFLVLESRAHAEARGAKALAKLSAVISDRAKREPGVVASALKRMWARIAQQLRPGRYAVLSGASGVEPATGEERIFLTQDAKAPIRATGTYIGHAMEPQFPMNIALAATVVSRGKLFPTRDKSGVESAAEGAIDQVVVTSVGHWRGEGLALVEAAG
jgi:3-oxoacyl-[acyl-carrier-protein] synthase II